MKISNFVCIVFARHILTAAHCIIRAPGKNSEGIEQNYTLEAMNIFLGMHNITSRFEDKSVTEIYISEDALNSVIVHENYTNIE